MKEVSSFYSLLGGPFLPHMLGFLRALPCSLAAMNLALFHLWKNLTFTASTTISPYMTQHFVSSPEIPIHSVSIDKMTSK